MTPPRKDPTIDGPSNGRVRVQHRASAVSRSDASDDPPQRSGVTRRGFGSTVLTSAGLAGSGGALLVLSSEPTQALETEDWIVNGASILTEYGEITGVLFGDTAEGEDDGIVVRYEGLNEPGRELVLEIRVRGTDDNDEAGWAAGDVPGWETLASGSSTLSETGGTKTMTWAEAFGADKPVNVTDHSEITLGDFEVADGEEERIRTLEVELSVSVPAEGIEHNQSKQAEIEVNVDPRPRIDVFDLIDQSNPQHDRVLVEWEVSELLSELDEVTTEIRPEGETDVLDSETTAVDGQEATGEHELDGDGNGQYEIDLSVTDIDGNVRTETKSFGAEQDFDEGDIEFTLLTAEVTDSRGSAETPTEVTFEYELNVSDPQSVQFIVEVEDDFSNEIVEGTGGTVTVDRGDTGPPSNESTATVTADIDGGERCSRDITVDDGEVNVCE